MSTHVDEVELAARKDSVLLSDNVCSNSEAIVIRTQFLEALVAEFNYTAADVDADNLLDVGKKFLADKALIVRQHTDIKRKDFMKCDSPVPQANSRTELVSLSSGTASRMARAALANALT